jgi:glycosyltransferase involved in cell wall biosynthesis
VRVALDASFLGAQRGGDETFMSGLLEGLARRRGPEDTFALLLPTSVAPPSVRGDHAFSVVPLRRGPGPWHFAVTLPAALRRMEPLDLALSVTHIPLTGATPAALVLGDLSFVHRPQDYPAATARRLRTLVPRHLARARAVLVPSEFTRQDILTTYGLEPERVHVVPNRVGPAVVPEGEDARTAAEGLAAQGVRPPYLLYLGNLHPRKNVGTLVSAFLRARRDEPRLRGHRLVVAGARWFRGSAEQGAAGGDRDVVFLGRVSDTARSLLLSGAEALAYVSLFEGFGLPPLEAMAHGVPVLTSTVASMPEVCGDAALYVDPTDLGAVTAGVRQILRDDGLRCRLRLAGPARAAAFDADRVGDAALRAFRAATRSAHDVRVPSRRRRTTG